MKRVARATTLLAWLAALGLAALPRAAAAAAADVPPVFVVQIDGGIGPATAEQVARGLARAAAARAQLVVLQMDTPGGLDTAMRSIIKDILASPVPVAAYVSPQGARAASAGTYILYAAHIAAMAPATNLGAATPIAIGLPLIGTGRPPEGPDSAASTGAGGHDTLESKRINDATAYIRALAQLRGRNAAWGEQAVREAVSLSATEALSQGVIDLVAVDTGDLLRRLDGRVVRVARIGGVDEFRLATAKAAVVRLEPDARARVLSVIGDPSLVLLLMMIGVYGLLFEFLNPGFVVPGVVGAVCLLLALWGLQMLPVHAAGLAFILLGIAFFVAEAYLPSYGALGLGGVAAFGFGALMLFDSDAPGFGIPRSLIAGLTGVSAVFVVFVARMAARARRRPVVSGLSAMIGAAGEVVEFGAGQGWALIDGEHWRVRADARLSPGEPVRVVAAAGLTLEVRPAAEGPATRGVPP